MVTYSVGGLYDYSGALIWLYVILCTVKLHTLFYIIYFFSLCLFISFSFLYHYCLFIFMVFKFVFLMIYLLIPYWRYAIRLHQKFYLQSICTLYNKLLFVFQLAGKLTAIPIYNNGYINKNGENLPCNYIYLDPITTRINVSPKIYTWIH